MPIGPEETPATSWVEPAPDAPSSPSPAHVAVHVAAPAGHPSPDHGALQPLRPLGVLPRPGARPSGGKARHSDLRTMVISMVAGAMVGVLPIVFAPGLFDEVHRLAPSVWVGMPTIAVALVLAVALHEYGHVAGGQLAGWRAMLWNVGPVRLARVHDRWRLRLHGVWQLWGGIALSAPPRVMDAQALRRANLWMVAGGPGASLLGGALGMGGWWLLRHADGAAPRWMALLGMLAGGFSALLGLVTLFPARMGPVLLSDGKQLLELRRRDVVDTPTFALRALRLYSSLVRPRDWPDHLLQAAMQLPDAPTERASAHWFAAMAALDRGEPAQAHHHARAAMDALAEEGDPLLVGLFAADLEGTAAVLEALVRHDTVAAQALLDSAAARGSSAEPSLGLARAAIAQLTGNDEAAAIALAAARRAIDDAPMPIGLEVHRPVLAAMRAI